MIAGFLHAAAQFVDAVATALDEQHACADPEAGDWLDASGLADAMTPDVVDAQVHCEGCLCPTICACGRAIYAELNNPDDRHPVWFHRDDDSAIGLGCTRTRDSEPDQVTQEDLAARIGATILDSGAYPGPMVDVVSTSLLAQYRITEKESIG